MYPKANFVHLNDCQEPRGCSPARQPVSDHVLQTIHELPAANSTFNTSYYLSHRTIGTDVSSSFFQRSFRSNSTSKAIGSGDPIDDECDPDCQSNNVTRHRRHSPRSCNRSNCTNPSCGIVTREPSPNVDNESHIPRFFRAIRRSLGLARESTPRPESDLECSNMEHESPRRGCGRSGCNNTNCGRIPSPTQEDRSHNVGHSSHIPRSCVPKPSTYNIPSFMDRTVGTDTESPLESPEIDDDNLFGLVRLKQNDVCYTSGTIEWVGRKRTFPVNSGFKTLNVNELPGNEPMHKRVKKLDQNVCDDFKECECVEMLPTVNAIVDHLNALHQAVDLIDLRLNTVEDTMFKD